MPRIFVSLTLKIIWEMLSFHAVDDYFGIFLLFIAYLCLLTTKVIISIMLLSMAHAFILTDQQRSGQSFLVM